jgi:hypothetical protein
MSKRKLVLTVAVCTLLHSSLGIAASYDYHPKSRLYLGGGYNPFHSDDAYQVCLEHRGIKPVDTEGATSTQVEMIRLRSQEEFFKETQFSASIEGSYAFFSGGGSISSHDAEAFQSDAFTWMVLFRSNYGRFILDRPNLMQTYSGLPTRELETKCGSEVVTEATKAVSAYALFTVKNVSSQQMHQFEQSFHASARGVFWNVEMSQKYASFMKLALANSQVQFRMAAIGGDGVTKLTELLESSVGASADPYEKFYHIPKVLEDYIKTQTKEKAAPVSYNTQRIGAFTSATDSLYPKFRSEMVEQLYLRYHNAIGISERLNSILYGNESGNYDLNDADFKRLSDAYNVFSDNVNKLASAGLACFDIARQPECKLPMETRVRMVWPKRSNYCEELRLRAKEFKIVNDDQYQEAVKHNFVPVFKSDGKTITVNEWVTCSELGYGVGG